jgi:hypothetical protein
MPTATIDGREVNYVVKGSGPAQRLTWAAFGRDMPPGAEPEE